MLAQVGCGSSADKAPTAATPPLPPSPAAHCQPCPGTTDCATKHGNPINKRGPLLHCLHTLPYANSIPYSSCVVPPLLLISRCGVFRAMAYPYLVLPTRAVPSPPASRDHISPFFSVHARSVMLTHKVLSSGQLWNIFTLMCSLGAHLAPLIIDLHGSSLVKVQGRSHRPDSHSTWHAERGKTDYCSKETVSPRNQLHVSHRSFTLMFPH